MESATTDALLLPVLLRRLLLSGGARIRRSGERGDEGAQGGAGVNSYYTPSYPAKQQPGFRPLTPISKIQEIALAQAAHFSMTLSLALPRG